MTDKEQIIINGVDVRECSYYNPLGNYNCGGTKKCSQWSNCYYKQLVRKKQECEELKEYIQANKATGICETCTHMALIENDRYRKALKEIKKIIISEDVTTKPKLYDFEQDNKILDIINKAMKVTNE